MALSWQQGMVLRLVGLKASEKCSAVCVYMGRGGVDDDDDVLKGCPGWATVGGCVLGGGGQEVGYDGPEVQRGSLHPQRGEGTSNG